MKINDEGRILWVNTNIVLIPESLKKKKKKKKKKKYGKEEEEEEEEEGERVHMIYDILKIRYTKKNKD